MNEDIPQLYTQLTQRFGDPSRFWPQWCTQAKSEELRQLIAIGTILVQRTSWHNAEIALQRLISQRLADLAIIAQLHNPDDLAELIRPAGFRQTKPKRLIGLARFVVDRYGTLTEMRQQPMETLRSELLTIYGVGPETADTLLLYALDKPSFIIDTYTQRFVSKYNLANTTDYNQLKKLFESSLPTDTSIFQKYHILMIVDQKGAACCQMKPI